MAEWKIGESILGEYLIEKELGRGGMGRVCLVRSNSTGRRFAVKQTLVHDEKHRKAFLTELQTWIDLPEHPNIVPCRFFRTVDDEIVIFADYVDGGSLADWIAKRKLTTLEQILDVAIQFAWGLHAIHERRLVHQDVKPGNVLMTGDGVPMVTDFGLARARLLAGNGSFGSPGLPPAQESVLVSFGGMTPAYASPKQRAGQALSRKTDIWSWGVSVLDMFMGGVSCPHGGHIAAEVLESFVENGQQEAGLPAMPEGVATILNKCFERDQLARWSDMCTAAANLSATVAASVGRAYSRSAPLFTRQAGGRPYVRRTYTGGVWSDPQDWLSVAYAMEGGDISRVPSPSQRTQQSRSASAVSDLTQYREAYDILTRLANDGHTEAAKEVCDLCFEMAHIHGELNDVQGELATYDQCIKYARMLGAESGAGAYSDLMIARALDQQAIRYRICGDIGTAIACYAGSIQHWRHLLQSDEDAVAFESNYALTLRNAAIALRNANDLPAAIALYDEAIEVFSRLSSLDTCAVDAVHKMNLQKTLRFKGVALRKAGHVEDARHCYSQAMTILEEMAHVRSDSEYYTELARLNEARACVLPLGDAVTELKKAIGLYEMLIGDYSSRNLLVDLAGAFCSCCGALSETGRTDEALDCCDKGLRVWDEVIHRMGKNEYAPHCYQARLVRLSLLLRKGDTARAEVDGLRLSHELRAAVESTGDTKLLDLYQVGRANGYW